ncbi:MAG: hypothetical protein QW760_01820 [Thermofilaceae archaeon]
MSERDQVLLILARKIHGDIAGRIAERLSRVGEATDEQLSQALGIEIGLIRRLLNELYESRLVRYRRVRDVDQGWYLYYWRLTDEDPFRVVEERKKRVLENLKLKLEHEESGSYFICQRCNARYSFDDIVDYMFRCPECGSDLEAIDNSLVVNKLRIIICKLEGLKLG